MNLFLQIREFLINNFFISIKTLQINETIIKNNIFFYLLRLVPFFILKVLFDYFNVKYIYLMDDLYFSNYSNEIKFSPVLMSFYGYLHILDNDKINLMESFKKYNCSIPLWFFLENEKLNNINMLNIKYFSKGKIIEKNIIIKDNEDKLICDIF